MGVMATAVLTLQETECIECKEKWWTFFLTTPPSPEEISNFKCFCSNIKAPEEIPEQINTTTVEPEIKFEEVSNEGGEGIEENH
jgi:hypothetical protein